MVAQRRMKAARVLREMLLLGKARGYGDTLTEEEVSQIPAPGLRAMVEARDIELMGDLEATTPGREVADLRREVADLLKRIDRNERRINELTEKLDGSSTSNAA